MYASFAKLKGKPRSCLKKPEIHFFLLCKPSFQACFCVCPVLPVVDEHKERNPLTSEKSPGNAPSIVCAKISHRFRLPSSRCLKKSRPQISCAPLRAWSNAVDPESRRQEASLKCDSRHLASLKTRLRACEHKPYQSLKKRFGRGLSLPHSAQQVTYVHSRLQSSPLHCIR